MKSGDKTVKNPFFNKSEELISDINGFLDTLQETSLIFKKGIKLYFKGDIDKFNNNLEHMRKLENSADKYQKDIKFKLYRYMLIPESRGDVLSLLESTDNVIDLSKKVLTQFSIEKPDIPKFLTEGFLDLTEQSVLSVNELVKGIRSYFEEIAMVNNYINKVHFYEHQADELEESMEREVFSSDKINDLPQKTYIRYFIEKIALISDKAERVTEKLSVAAIKRSI